ncbi:hypothetical protein Bca4012_074415 [Brassica carinata]
MTTSLRATSCAICRQDLEPAQRWRCQVCPDYEVCGPCCSNGIINHPHTLISPQSPTGQLRAVLLHVTTCCTTQCQYPRCRTVKLLLRHGVTCKKRVCNHCKRMWDIFRMHARNCREPQCTIPKCSEFRARFSRSQQQADSRRCGTTERR